MGVRAVLTPYRVRLSRPPENARARFAEREGLLLSLEYEGDVGQGEAAPLPGFSSEPLEAARERLEGFDFSRVPDPAELDAAELAALTASGGLAESAAARFAVETALVDLAARRRGVPFHRRLGELGGTYDRAAPPSLGLAALVDELALDAARDRAEQARGAGFDALKIKIGREGRFDEELALLAALRAAHPALPLRLDANGAFDPALAPSRLAALAPFHPELVEEPVRAGAPLVADPAVPVALDESLARGFALDRAAARRAGLVAIVVKPGLHGLLGACELAARARHLGLAVIVSHAFEGPIGYAAAVELALALSPAGHAQGLAPHAALDPWPPALRPAGLAGARLARHAAPGLGLARVEGPLPA